MTSWSRPSDVAYPRTWLQFESAKVKGQHFVIKDLSEEYYDTALGYLTNLFLRESGISGPLNITVDEEAREQMQKIWLTMLESKMAIICLSVDKKLPRVTGLHMTAVKQKNNNMNQLSSPAFSTFAKVVEQVKDAGEVFERFGSDYYLGSLGLFVLPEFRGHGIATNILRAREHMCRSFGLKGTATVFSTPGAQRAAMLAGYQTFAEETAADVEKKHGVKIAHNLKIMGRAFV